MGRPPRTDIDPRKCGRCKEFKPRSDFYSDKHKPAGISSYCRPCDLEYRREYRKAHAAALRVNEARWRAKNPTHTRRKMLARQYGLSEDQFQAMLSQQGGRCAICHTADWGKRAAHVDHDHETGEVRALLCRNCNSGIGMFKDDPDLLYAASEYLSIHKRPLLRLVS